jgi:hypothetical protein
VASRFVRKLKDLRAVFPIKAALFDRGSSVRQLRNSYMSINPYTPHASIDHADYPNNMVTSRNHQYLSIPSQFDGSHSSLEMSYADRTQRLSASARTSVKLFEKAKKTKITTWRNGESNARPFQDKLISANGMLYQLNHIPAVVNQTFISFI